MGQKVRHTHFVTHRETRWRPISPIIVAGSDSAVTQCKGARHDHRRGLDPVFCTIVPPHVLDKLARGEDPAVSGPARRTLEGDARERGRRRVSGAFGRAAATGHEGAGGPAAAHAVRRRARHRPAGHRSARGGLGAQLGRQGQPGLRRTRRHLRPLPQGVRPQLDRRRGPAAGRDRPLRRGVQQRLLRRRADGLRGRRRRDLPRLHRRGRRDRPRTGPRPHAVHRQPPLRGPVRRALRVRVRRLRRAGEAVLAGPERRAGGLGRSAPGCWRRGSAGRRCAR
ncbi:hypothetical protein SALBM311S_02166 [Streptomyces alboniger]